MAAQQLQADVDALLQRYLGLLDEYTGLRCELSALQAGVHQHLARANFAAERGARYGRDHYDQRMRATRLLSVCADGGAGVGGPVFAVGGAGTAAAGAARGDARGDAGRDAAAQASRAADGPPTDPLRWFGLLAPPALRAAQGLSVEAVQRVIPRLASVDAEMRSVEIEVQRARKRRARALAASARADNKAADVAATEAPEPPPLAEAGRGSACG